MFSPRPRSARGAPRPESRGTLAQVVSPEGPPYTIVVRVRSAWITGVSGFLGQALARLLHGTQIRTIGLGRGARENAPLPWLAEYHQLVLPVPEVEELLLRTQPDVIFHCAGSASVESSFLNPLGDYEQNTIMVVTLLEAMRKVNSSAKFVLVSSAAVYGDPKELPIRETAVPRPLSPYGYHKLEAELACRKYAELLSLSTVVARVFSAYGVGLRRQVVWDIARRAVCDEVVTVRGTGSESRDFIHGKDVARALLLLAESPLRGGEIVNVASGEEVRIGELATQIVRAMDPNKAIAFSGESSPGVPSNWRADIERLRALGFSPSVPLSSGIEDLARWVKSELGV